MKPPVPMKLVKATAKAPSLSTCGLCGSSKRLTETECCGNVICDDEDEYVLFSYARNSCYRNHRRQTVCGAHHEEGHKGDWKTCAKCRGNYEPEMFAWWATNEYNFEKLESPPAFSPTFCAGCGKRIVLAEGGYCLSGGKYWCAACDPPRRTTKPKAKRRARSGG